MKKHRLLIIIPLIVFVLFSVSCGDNKEVANSKPYETQELVFKERVELEYAQQFSIDRYEKGFSMITICGNQRYLLVPQNSKIPADINSDIKIINQPADNIYLAATSVMGLFDAVGCVDAIGFSGTKAEDWYIDSAQNAMNRGSILYAGKYREPDYELLVSNNCRLSIQSTMIEHTPEVKEKLEELGISVFVDYSSYEPHPLGRSEWIKVYGEITNTQGTANRLFEEQASKLSENGGFQNTGKTAVFFYISNSGQAVTRKPGDYITKMIELAGGINVFKDIGSEDATSTVTMEMESFYSKAKDADYIIYNSTIDGEISSVRELIEKNPLIADFKAVKNDNVWCTKNNLFQESMKLGTVISDFNKIFTDNYSQEPTQFIYKLEREE